MALSALKEKKFTHLQVEKHSIIIIIPLLYVETKKMRSRQRYLAGNLIKQSELLWKLSTWKKFGNYFSFPAHVEAIYRQVAHQQSPQFSNAFLYTQNLINSDFFVIFRKLNKIFIKDSIYLIYDFECSFPKKILDILYIIRNRESETLFTRSSSPSLVYTGDWNL